MLVVMREMKEEWQALFCIPSEQEALTYAILVLDDVVNGVKHGILSDPFPYKQEMILPWSHSVCLKCLSRETEN